MEDDRKYNFKNNFDEDNEVFAENINEEFSTYSHNIRSINGHWDDILDIISSAQPMKFFHEIWSVQKTYAIPGYGKFEFITRDKNSPPNPNCGGGVGLFVDEKFEDYEILKEELFSYLTFMNHYG